MGILWKETLDDPFKFCNPYRAIAILLNGIVAVALENDWYFARL